MLISYIKYLVGQVAGYILLYLMRSVESIGNSNIWLIGVIYGVAFWAVALPVAAARGVVNPPWTQGIPTVISSMAAFIAFGIISSYTVKVTKQIEA